MIDNFDHRPLLPFDAFLAKIGAFRPDLRCGGLVALTASLVLAATMTSVAMVRVRVANQAILSQRAALARSDEQTAPARNLLARVHAAQALERQIAQAQDSGGRAADELTRLGNRVPADAWIDAIRREGSSLTIDGGARRPEAAGAAILSLRSPGETSELLALRESRTGDTTSGVRYTARVQPR